MSRGPGTPSARDELANFTNRLAEREAIGRLLDRQAGDDVPVLVFYGVGGVGKTLLVKKARAEWLPEGMPAARLDLDPVSGQALYQNNVPSALAEIRRQFGVECPAFELAHAMLGHLQGGDRPSMRHGAAGSGAWEFVVEAGQALAGGVPGAGLVGWVVKKGAGRLGQGFESSQFGQWLLSQAGNEDYFRLRRMDPSDIADDLFRRLGEDLSTALPDRGGRACRAVLFLDTFEKLREGHGGDARQFRAEEWVRRIYGELGNVLVVLAGRDRVVWGEADARWNDPRYVQQHLVGGLSEHDAREFLARCDVEAAPLQDAILGASLDVSVEGDRSYHPYSLALAVDAVREERKGFREPDPASFRLQPEDQDALAQQFLRSLGDGPMVDWVKRLSLTPSFDEAAAKAAFEGEARERAWDDLLDFSFVVPAEPGVWTLHARMTESLRHAAAKRPDRLRRWHEAWRAIWAARIAAPDDPAAFRAWFHLWHLDDAAAQAEWNGTVEALRRQALTLRHYALLDWWTPILAEPMPVTLRADVENNLATELVEAMVGDRGRNLERAVSLFRAALRVYTEEGAPREWAGIQNNLGGALVKLPTGDRVANVAEAVQAFRAGLRIFTEGETPWEWATNQHNLGAALVQIPDDRAANFEAAVEAYRAAVRIRTEGNTPWEWAMTQNNLGNALARLPNGDQTANLNAAMNAFQAALRVRTEEASPLDWAATQFNLGALFTSGHLRNPETAMQTFQAVLRVWTEESSPFNWAETLVRIAYLHAELKRISDALEALHAAERGYASVGLVDQVQEVRDLIAALEGPADDPAVTE